MSDTVDYDSVASTYDRRYDAKDYAGVAQALPVFVGAPAPPRVLEVGCGTGHWLAVPAGGGRSAWRHLTRRAAGDGPTGVIVCRRSASYTGERRPPSGPRARG